MSYANLKSLLARSDHIDIASGRVAYSTYHDVIRSFANYYGADFHRTLAAFVALSPNNDYFGNLRSLASVLDGRRRGIPVERVTVSTYKHCRDRAMRYVTGEVDFMETAKGPKITAFFQNIMDPDDPWPVTIDGHIVNAYRATNATMKQAVRNNGEYEIIASAVRRLARQNGMVANQMQATLWLTRKRVLNIKFDGQLDLFGGFGPSGLNVKPEDAPPYKPMEV